MKRFAICLLLLPLCAFAETPEPPIAPLVKKADPPAPPPVNIAAIKARRAQIAELLRQDAADIAELQKQLKELGLDAAQVAPLGIGRPGHSPVVDFGTGADADRLTVDGKVKGPHLTGPQGPVGPQGPPGVSPKPPEPPQPSPAPIPVDGFRVLIVYETDGSGLPKMPEAQKQIIFSATVRSYLNTKTPVGTDSKTHEWRMWDKDSDVSQESKLWQDAFKRPRTSVPWIIVSNGKTGFEGPLPATVDDAMALLRKYGE